MIVVELYPTQMEADVLYLIVEAATGIVYTNQCGGYSCEAMKAEGYLVPIGTEEDRRRIFDWFWSRYDGYCFCDGRLAGNPGHVQELDALISTLSCWFLNGQSGQSVPLKLDMARISECCEAWIPVVSPYGRGYLTLINSD